MIHARLAASRSKYNGEYSKREELLHDGSPTAGQPFKHPEEGHDNQPSRFPRRGRSRNSLPEAAPSLTYNWLDEGPVSTAETSRRPDLQRATLQPTLQAQLQTKKKPGKPGF
jgi:hypothetical protein